MERKVAIVTGSATGVGAATAVLLAEKGCNVIINYTKSKKEADETAEIIRKKGIEAIVCQGDVANDDDCRAMAQAAVDAWGRIDYLVNNAGKTKFNPFPNLEGLTKGMAIDLAKNNIRVNTICPTFVDTPMTKRFFKNKNFKREVLNKIPLGRIAEVSDVATAVAFLASNASSMITGTSILVDGGWTAI